MSAGKTLRQRLSAFAKKCGGSHGFDAVGITDAHFDERTADRLKAFVTKGHHGSMGWMRETLERRQSPIHLWPEAKSIIMLALNYGPESNPLDALDEKSNGVISVYARNRDYHDIIKGRLKTMAGQLLAHAKASGMDGDVKVFVDTAPVMEKPLASKAGLGWQGKHTNLVSRQKGSWLFLGCIFTTLELEPDAPEADHCGSCQSCLDICPTKAFPAPYQLDARRCISYLTIEHKGPIPREFREVMGNRIFGCDDCLAICPWNKFASLSNEAKLSAPSVERKETLAELLALDDASFRKVYAGSPVKRIGRSRFIRNCLIAAGNSGDQNLVRVIKRHLNDPDPLVRGAAVWALNSLVPVQIGELNAMRDKEKDPIVIEELDALQFGENG